MESSCHASLSSLWRDIKIIHKFLKYGEPGYFRIIEYIEMLKKVFLPKLTMHEIGSSYPYISYYFLDNYGYEIMFSDIFDETPCSEYKEYYKKINLCRDPIGSWDVITCTEVLEHLPCNLYKVRDKLIDAVKEGGYLLISAPVAGIGRQGRRLEENLNFSSNVDHGHLREFLSPKEFLDFFTVPQLKLIDKKFSERGSYVLVLLYQKINPMCERCELEPAQKITPNGYRLCLKCYHWMRNKTLYPVLAKYEPEAVNEYRKWIRSV